MHMSEALADPDVQTRLVASCQQRFPAYVGQVKQHLATLAADPDWRMYTGGLRAFGLEQAPAPLAPVVLIGG
eukprot:CAMPEP_0198552586 /NCGR_PEP_ID=MMETSP1462-20131121/78938_1 /TAXON_ID=1333877 /ORGANISM="Brandtodinium nutriculum, Strain RCC3387" /LENGTH=71 /DNA_ID=CAMNT_0044283249 /DNA_START=24 /DNA_END=236 /DNA_ORIENTATION=+